MSPDVPEQCQVELTWSVLPSCPHRAVELWWLCVLRVVLGVGCVCSCHRCDRDSHTEGASLISEPFLIRWKTLLSFLCSLSGSCTSNSVLKLTCSCCCSAVSQLQLPREGECLPQHLVLVYEHLCEGCFQISSFCAWEATVGPAFLLDGAQGANTSWEHS